MQQCLVRVLSDSGRMMAGENIGVHEGPRETALQADVSPNIEALLFSYTPDNFLSYFPYIPYSKGASVWNMLEAYWDTAGPDAFRVSRYPH